MARADPAAGVQSRAEVRGRTGRVFDIQRFSIHDGPGIRTTVFLKACPLRCLWCHNPESVSPQPLLSFAAGKCIACGSCVEACPNGVQILDGQRGHLLLRERCELCGCCAEVCPSGALQIAGRDVSVAEVIETVVRDRPFYEASGGGITLSGGEPLLQIDFTEALLCAAKGEGLHTAVETAGYATFGRLARILPHTDLFLYDLKETNDALHRKYTGVPVARILDNLRTLHAAGASILVRLPIVPGLNDRPEHFRKVARLVGGLPNLLGVEVMPYHNLGVGKQERFALQLDARANPPPPGPETVAAWVRTLRKLGVSVLNEV